MSSPQSVFRPIDFNDNNPSLRGLGALPALTPMLILGAIGVGAWWLLKKAGPFDRLAR